MRIEPESFMSDDQKKGRKNKIVPTKRISTGKKILAPVAHTYKMRNGKKVLEVAYVCIKDLEKRGEEGAIFVDNFIISANTQWKIANLSIALDYIKPFDDEKYEDVRDVLHSNTFIGVFIEKTFNGNPYIDIKYYNRNYTQEKDDDNYPVFSIEEDKIITKAESGWKQIRSFRSNHMDKKYGDYIDDPLPTTDSDNGDDYGHSKELPF